MAMSALLVVGLLLASVQGTPRASSETTFPGDATLGPSLGRQSASCAINNICFAIDRSGSIQINYPRLQEFVVAMANEIDSRTTNTKYAAVGFATDAVLIQGPTTDLAGVFTPEVNAALVPSGSSNMGEGLRLCSEQIEGEQGNRVVIVITDGRDTGTPKATSLSTAIEAKGIRISTVGIGPLVAVSYLRKLATGRERFALTSFTSLLSDVLEVSDAACSPDVPTTTVPTTTNTVSTTTVSTTTTTTIAPCALNVVCFAIDQSGSIQTKYGDVQNFVKIISRDVESRTVDTVYSAVGFSSDENVITDPTMDLEGSFIPAVEVPVTPSGSTNMAAAVEKCYDFIKDAAGNRVIVLVTDGRDSGFPKAKSVVGDIKKDDVSIITVGVGPLVDITYLRNLASATDRFVFSSDFSKLAGDAILATNAACAAPGNPVASPDPVDTPTELCGTPKVCFALDQTSTARAEYSTQTSFAVKTATLIGEVSSGAMYSAYGYAKNFVTIQSPTSDLTGTFIPALNAAPTATGVTHMYGVVNQCITDLSSHTGKKIIILVADGKDFGTPRASELKDEIKAQRIKFVAVGVGNDINKNYIKKLTTKRRYTFLKSFSKLGNKGGLVRRLACDLD